MTSNEIQNSILEMVGDGPEGATTDEICRRLKKTPQQLGDLFEEVAEGGAIRGFAGLWLSPPGLEKGVQTFMATLNDLHSKTPGQSGIPRERVVHTAGLRWAGKPLDRLVSYMEELGLVAKSGTTVRQVAFRPQLPARQREFLDRVLAVIEAEEIGVPTPPEIARAVVTPAQAVSEILQVGVRAGELVQVTDAMFFTPRQIEKIQAKLKDSLGKREFSATEAKEALGTSRKYIIPILEHLDTRGFTKRTEDTRVIKG